MAVAGPGNGESERKAVSITGRPVLGSVNQKVPGYIVLHDPECHPVSGKQLKCGACHAGSKVMAGLDSSALESTIKGRANGPVVQEGAAAPHRTRTKRSSKIGGRNPLTSAHGQPVPHINVQQ